MKFTTTQACPNHKCQELHTVFLTAKELPEMGALFQYRCPKCGTEVVFSAGAFTIVDGQPPGTLLASRYVHKA
jgi:hypothetical protein